ncbi:hypothetical protein YC2023_115860 [Brassica napus]
MGWIYPCIGEFQSMVDISSTERSERSVSCFEETKIIVKGVVPCFQNSEEIFSVLGHIGLLADPEGGQCTAWDKGLLIGGENVITCFAREGCTNKPSRELSPLLLHFIANLLL